MKMWRIPPRLGEHTEEVLRESGVERSEIETLRAARVIN
jgi:crotonobetainyl-CoA:carnitine CoA-transferase CaiB-like acyl-CoA transferase